MKNALITCMMVGVSLLMLTCGEAPELSIPNPGPNPGPTPGPKLTLTDEERLAVLKECSQTVDLLGDLKQDAAREVLVAYLKSRPEFANAGNEEGNVWAHFHDGRVAIFVPNWAGAEEDPGGRKATVDPGRIASSSTMGRTSELPASNKGTLFYGLGRAFIPDDRPFLKSLFDKSHTKYKGNVDLQDATIENLRAVNDLGIFYINTHGGVGFLMPRSDSVGLFGLWTMDTCSIASERTYLPELNSHMLVYMNAVDDDVRKTEWHYGITNRFVSHGRYMNFAADAFYYIDACNGMNGYADDFKTSMVKAAANGKATYIGWTRPTSGEASDPAARFIFDRLLGTHDQSVPMEDPVQRPFDWPRIFDDLPSFNLGVSTHGGRLAYYSIYTTEPMLTPTIKYIWMADYESTMVILGSFGGQPADGKVTVAGVAAVIHAWTPSMIMAEIPTKGDGSYGDVIVSVRGNESNKVPLSEWTIPMNVSVDDMGVTTEVILNLKIRADVHKYRTKPGEAPKMIRPDSLEMLENPTRPGWIFNSTSTGTYSVGGSRQVTCTVEGCTVRDTETVLNKSGNLAYKPLEAGLGFKAFYKWAEDMKTIYIQVMATIPNVGTEIEFYGKCPDKPEYRSNQSYPSTLGLSIPTEGITQLEIKLDDNFNVLNGQVSKTRFLTWGRCETSSRIITTAQWSNATPKSPPKDDTDARKGWDGGN